MNILIINYIRKIIPSVVKFTELDSDYTKSDGFPTVNIDKNDLMFVLTFLKKHTNCSLEQLVDMTVIDYPGRHDRFDIIYNLLSIDKNFRLILKIKSKLNSHVPSSSAIYSSSIWLEREIWDLFGVFFYNHPDLRRILTDYGFDGFPLRKDFPMTGYTEIRYDDEKKRVVQEPLEMSQEFRVFDFLSPWEKR